MSRSNNQAAIGLGVLAAALAVIAVVAALGNRNQGLRVDVLSARRVEPGDALTITISARDTNGVATAVDLDFGDGNQAPPPTLAGCAAAPTGATTETFDFEHRYPNAGVYTVTARVSSGCTGPPESAEAIRTIQVKPVRR